LSYIPKPYGISSYVDSPGPCVSRISTVLCRFIADSLPTLPLIWIVTARVRCFKGSPRNRPARDDRMPVRGVGLDRHSPALPLPLRCQAEEWSCQRTRCLALPALCSGKTYPGSVKTQGVPGRRTSSSCLETTKMSSEVLRPNATARPPTRPCCAMRSAQMATWRSSTAAAGGTGPS